MTPNEYCTQKSAPPGSALYYSIRRLPQKQRTTIIAIYAFYQEIEDITLHYEDPGTAHTKMNWWRDEVIKIQDGTPDHPVALALQQSSLPFSPSRLIEIIDGLEQNLAAPTFDKFEDVVIHIMRTAGVRELLLAEVVQKNEPISSEVIYQLALTVELVNYIQHLRRYVRRNLIYFSQDELDQFHVTDDEFHKYVTTKSIRDLLQFQSSKIERSYQEAQRSLNANSRKQLGNLMIRCEIARAILRAIETTDYTVLENFIDITPLRRWWISWRG